MKNQIVVCDMKESDLEQALQLWKTSFNAGFSVTFETIETLIKYLIRMKRSEFDD